MPSLGKSNSEQREQTTSTRPPHGAAVSTSDIATSKPFARLRIPTNTLCAAEKIVPALLRESSQFSPEGPLYAGCEPPRHLSKLSVFYSMAAEHLLVVREPSLDPVLCRWLDKHVAIAKQFPTELQQVESLMSSVRSTFSRSPNRLFHPLATTRYREMTDNNDETPRLMGEFINNQIGDCRHIAMLLQVALQETGIPSAILIGDLEKRVGPSPGEVLFSAFHALNVVVADGRYRVVDPAHRINQGLGYQGTLPVTPSDLVDRFMRKTLSTDPETSWAGETFRFNFKAVDTSLAGLPPLCDADTEKVLRGIKRANLS